MPQLLKQSVLEWRRRDYDCDDYPLIGGILSFQMETQEGTSILKYLRLLRRTYDRILPASLISAQYRSLRCGGVSLL